MKPDQDNNSNRDAVDSARHDEAFVQQRLESLDRPEPIDPQFIERLSDRLDAEFAACVGVATVPVIDHDEPAELPKLKESNGEVTRNGSKRTRMFPHWLGGIVAAALLLGMFSFWTVQPPTSWAEMIEALKSAPWVQTDSGRTSSWFSASNQVVARRDTNQTMFASRNAGTHLNYVREDARIYQTAAVDHWPPLEHDLIAWLARSSNGSIEPDGNWTVVSETASSIDDATGRWLKLTVVFESSKPMTRAFTAIFMLNPETKLPVSCQVREGALASGSAVNKNNWQSVSFDYPTDGPADIFDLGVAAGTPIMLANSDSRIGLVGTNVKPALSADQLAKLNREPELSPKSLDPPPANTDAVEPAEIQPPKLEPAEREPTTPKVASAEPGKTTTPRM